MTKRIASLLLFLIVAFGIYAVARYAINLPADKRGYDAIDYVILHGSVSHENPISPVRPIDVTGVYINEGYANQTMIDLLRFLPNLRHITIGPDFSGTSANTPIEQLPKPTEAANVDLDKLRNAFPDLEIQIARTDP